jgi:hypothetical protein
MFDFAVAGGKVGVRPPPAPARQRPAARPVSAPAFPNRPAPRSRNQGWSSGTASRDVLPDSLSFLLSNRSLDDDIDGDGRDILDARREYDRGHAGAPDQGAAAPRLVPGILPVDTSRGTQGPGTPVASQWAGSPRLLHEAVDSNVAGVESPEAFYRRRMEADALDEDSGFRAEAALRGTARGAGDTTPRHHASLLGREHEHGWDTDRWHAALEINSWDRDPFVAAKRGFGFAWRQYSYPFLLLSLQ